jgi:integrase/recombinase XerD
MNHKPSGSLLLSKAIPGFINYKTAEGLSLRTIDSHERMLNK